MKKWNLYSQDTDALKPLVELCKHGCLFEVQDWIKAGKPVNPLHQTKGRRSKNSLETAIDKGFHSLVRVLLEGGSIVDDGSYSAIEHALSERRLDIIELLEKNGADLASVDMGYVFETWDPKIIEFFIEKGADVETGYRLAWALCDRIRTALGVFKRHQDKYSSFQEQLDIALRYHCREGDIKWVSLLLWAGADSFVKGTVSPDEKPNIEEDISALEWAALCNHVDVFKLKKIRIKSSHPIVSELMKYACTAADEKLLIELLKQGIQLAVHDDSGSSLIQSCLTNMQYSFAFTRFRSGIQKREGKSPAHGIINTIKLLALHDVKWVPADRIQISKARRSLLKVTSESTVEFVNVMAKYKACSNDDITLLIST